MLYFARKVDGKDISPVNNAQLEEQCSIILSKGIKSIVIVGVFSPLASTGTQEEYAKKVILDTIGPDTRIDVICSKDGNILSSTIFEYYYITSL